MVIEFTSALIRKRVDAFTLETINGFTILIDGTVKEKRTKLNGFPVEVSVWFQLSKYLFILYSSFWVSFIFSYASFSITFLYISNIRQSCKSN